MDAMNERIKQIREISKLSQKAFADKMGFSRDVISNIEYGRTDVKEYVTKAICREFDVDYIWLTTGRGEMFTPQDDNAIMSVVDQVLTGENDFARRIFKAFSVMDKRDWEALEKFINAVTEGKVGPGNDK